MNNFIYNFQHIPEHLNPVAFSVGSLNIGWYSLMYLVGFVTVYFLLDWRIKKGELKNNIFWWKSSNKGVSSFNPQNQARLQTLIFDFLAYAFFGVILGGRIGYVLFYNLAYYWKNPLAIISPFDPITHQFIGFYGMSYHGGLIGVLIMALIFANKNKLYFLRLANFIIPAVPAGYFFGRIGNFLNGELYGRITTGSWGMYFPNDYTHSLRYPSQLIEAILEGLLLFFILWSIRNNKKYQPNLLAFYLFGYAIARIIAEFFRQPDQQIGYLLGFLTMGQMLSFLMILLAGGLMIYSQKTKKMIQ